MSDFDDTDHEQARLLRQMERAKSGNFPTGRDPSELYEEEKAKLISQIQSYGPKELYQWQEEKLKGYLAEIALSISSQHTSFADKLRGFNQWVKLMKESAESGAVQLQAKEIAPMIEFNPAYLNVVLGLTANFVARVGLDEAQQIELMNTTRFWLHKHRAGETLLKAKLDELQNSSIEGGVNRSLLEKAEIMAGELLDEDS